MECRWYTSPRTPAAGTKLFTRRLDQPKATELPGTEQAIEPVLLTGRAIRLIPNSFDGGKLNKISVEGGAAVTLAAGGAFPNWGEDGNILASATGGLLRIPASGGPAEIVAGHGNGEVAFTNPQILPGGKAVLFAAYSCCERRWPTSR